MNYFYLHRQNGTVEMVCSACRAVVANSSDKSVANKNEVIHRCPPSDDLGTDLNPLRNRSAGLHRTIVFPGHRAKSLEYGSETNIPFAFLSIALVIYALPTALEFFATQYFNPWIASIVLGDLIGCVWLAAVFNMRKTGLLLYVILATLKCGLCILNAVPVTALFWLTDLLPAAVIAVRITRPARDRRTALGVRL